MRSSTCPTRLLALSLLVLYPGCGPSDSSAGDASGPDGHVPGADGEVPGADGEVPGADGEVPGADGEAPGADAAVDLPSYCQAACDTATDCDLGSVAYDADNYDCVGGGCVYLGCLGDGECQALGDDLCRQPAGYPQPLCLPACDTPADCDLGSAAYDADNYDCVGGVCVYAGCNDTAECQALGDNVCETPPGSSTPLCQTPCDTAVDCDQGSAPYSSDNYDCTGGICVYQGCNDTAECQALGDYVCP
jgi:hypothetical protein